MAVMSPERQAPPEPTPDPARERDLDAKLAAAATAKRERIAATSTTRAQSSLDVVLRRLDPAAPDQAAADRVLRIPLEEGDPPVVTAELSSALVPKRFEGATFDTFRPATPSQQTALDAVRSWILRARNQRGPMLALIGPQGTGKSHLLYAAAGALLAEGVTIYSRPWYRLADELRYGGRSPFVASKLLEAPEVRTMLWKQGIVLLDEVRPTASTAFDDTELAKFACAAYDERIAVLLTTNVSPLADVMGAPAASRFTQCVIDGPDRRQS